MLSVRPDPNHPVTKGYACIKGMHVQDYQNDPDRLLHPQKRSAAGWEQLSWERATAEIGQKLRSIRAQHGPGAVATYWGNAADSLSITLTNTFCQGFGSPNSFNVLSLEYTDRGAVAQRVLGNENLILQPDPSRAHFALLLGTNPLVTNGMSLLQRRPRIGGELQAIRRRGGKVVVVDPRRTETARVADLHLAIRPGTDLFLLLGMIQRILRTGRFQEAYVRHHAVGLERWLELAESLELGPLLERTGIPPAQIEGLADEFAEADGAFATTRVGVQTGHNTTLTEWAVMTLNAITGNIDRPGGLFFNPGVLDIPRLIERFTRRRNPAPSRVGGYPQIFGGPPASVLADDVLSDDPGRVRALVVVAGNPVLSFPNTAKIEAALRRLELLVCVDIYPSDTASFAHYALPAATLFEKGTWHFLTSNFEPYPYAEWKPKVVEPRGEARSEWRIFKDLSRTAGVPFLNDPLLDRAARVLDGLGIGFNEDLLFQYLLIGKLNLRRLKRTPGGIKLGEVRYGELLRNGLHTPDHKLHLAPEEFVAALHEALQTPPDPTPDYPFLLISGARRAASFNSWTHNIPDLMAKLKGSWATVNEADAARLGIASGQRIRVISPTGSLEIEARLSPDVRPGVVAVQQFWGHTYENAMRTSRSHPGVNVNFLHDDRALDRFTGMPVFNGTRCRLERLGEETRHDSGDEPG
jgi:anaerobic selenocysteine-containing dehydrogenase